MSTELSSQVPDDLDRSTSVRKAGAVLSGPGALLSLEWLAILAAPAVTSVILRTPPMATGLLSHWQMIDPNFYTAYAQHGSDLVSRYGVQDYFWVRLGFILPAHLMHILFGAVPGFIALRYIFALIAIGPGYLLFRRLFGSGAGAVFVATVLCSPVVLNAWGTDYPDSAAVAYLLGGMAALVMPAASRRSRFAWQAVAGILLGLTIHSQMIALPLVCAAVLGRLLVDARQQRRAALLDVTILAGSIVAVTAGFVGISAILYGRLDIFSPTIHQLISVRKPRAVAAFHSTTWRWMLRDIYLFVPPTVLVSWFAVRLRSRVRPSWSETALVSGALAQSIAYLWIQANNGWTLEYYFYSSMLWAGALLVTAFLIVAISRPLLRSPTSAWVPAVLVIAVPLASELWHPQFWLAPNGLLVIGVVVAVAAASRLALINAATSWIAATIVITGCFIITVGEPKTSFVAGQAFYPFVDYGAVLGHDTSNEMDVYRVISALPSTIPAAHRPGERVELWLRLPSSPGQYPPEVLNRASGQYLSRAQNSLNTEMPKFSTKDAMTLNQVRPTLLVLLSMSGDEFSQALTAVRPWRPTMVRSETLTSGAVTLHVQVLRLDAFNY
jgi:hypothetical protein